MSCHDVTCIEANVASDKMAYEVSVFNSQVASKANDGNISTVSCTRNVEVNPWWAVDLAEKWYVKHVDVVNDNNPIRCK